MNLLFKGLVRGGILFIIVLIISLWHQLQGSSDSSTVFIYNGLIAFFLGLTSVIYQINQWSFSKQIIAHYLAMLVTVFPTLLLSGFYPLNSFTDVLKVYLQFNKAGVILFFATYFIFKLFRRSNSVRTE
ncbi:DUF3021 family protein [Bacillus salacetis]|uniref:DUF3021 family protein n=1 Tax=Bacillus salacetis TaxID=2315464 RepID=UPI003BA3B32C